MKLHQQGNEIIVTELRPMSELPTDGSSFLMLLDGNYFIEMFYNLDKDEFDSYSKYNEVDCIGWLPMPQYRPELKQTKEDIHNYYGA